MPALKIENTAQAWGETLLALAEEASGDALTVGPELQLHHVLNDLSTVATAYAGRLGVEKQPPREEENADAAGTSGDAAVGQEAGTSAVAEEQHPVPEEHAAVAVGSDDAGGAGALRSNEPELEPANDPWAELDLRVRALEQAPPFDLPGWIRETLQAHHERISALEARVADQQDEIETLKRTQQRDTIVIPESLTPEAAFNPDDLRPEAWGSIERARTALSNRIHRKHRDLTAIRQSVLNAVTGLAALTERTDDEDAQLAQHRTRAERLEMIDIVRDTKLGDVAALDDLEDARLYDVDADWPA